MAVLGLLIVLALQIRDYGAAVRPLVTFTPNVNEILYLNPVTITCHVGSAAPENQRYYWYKDGKLLIEEQEQNIRICFVLKNNEGDYQCGTTTSDLSPPVTLNTTAGYLILQRPPLIYEGDPLTLRCHSRYGHEGTNTTFYKEDKEIKFSVDDSELHIDTADGGSSGTYRCTTLLLHPGDRQYYKYSAETNISVSVRPPDYTQQNIKRLILSVVVMFSAAGMIFYHIRG